MNSLACAVPGIGTYGRNLARALAAAGRCVAVFTRSALGSTTDLAESFRFTPCSGLVSNLLDSFAHVHAARQFDLIGCAEFGADGAAVMDRFPAIAREGKLHIASYQLRVKHNNDGAPAAKLRFIAGALRRGQWTRRFWKPAVSDDAEHRVELDAEIVADRDRRLIINVLARDTVGTPLGMASLGGFDPDSLVRLVTGTNQLALRLDVPSLANGKCFVDLDLEESYGHLLDRVRDQLTFEALRKPASLHGQVLQTDWGVGSIELPARLIMASLCA